MNEYFKITIVALCIAFIGGWLFFESIPTLPLRSRTTNHVFSKDIPRTPSSLIEKQNTTTSSAINLNCNPALTNHTQSLNSQIRFVGKVCDEVTTPHTAIVNLNNHYTATIIELPNKKFTTDFIVLSEGENKIEITQYFKEKKEQKSYWSIKYNITTK